MSKEHAYAYEAGYRDGSIHYELEHCPACKNVADLQEALEDNAKLREQLEYALQTSRARLETIDRLKAENAKLRELVGDIWEFGFSNSAGANSVKEWYRVRDELEQRVYAALGVDDG